MTDVNINTSVLKVVPNGDQLINFGKYAKLTFHTLAETQRGYVYWLFRHKWFQSNYPKLYEYMSFVGLNREESVQAILVHNIIPIDHAIFLARFTDDNELLRLIRSILGKKHSYNITNIVFGHLCRSDIVVDVERRAKNLVWATGIQYFTLLLKLKSSLSNDYLEILRQMRQQRSRYNQFNTPSSSSYEKHRSYECFKNSVIQQALVIRSYTGHIDEFDIRKIFGEIQIINVLGRSRTLDNEEVYES